MRAADYYYRHLDRSIPIILLSDSTPNPGQSGDIRSRPDCPLPTMSHAQPNQEAASGQHSAAGYGMDDEQLDSLLQSGSPDDFILEALQQDSAADHTKRNFAQEVSTPSNSVWAAAKIGGFKALAP